MESGFVKILDPKLYRRGQLQTTITRWVSIGVVIVSLLFVGRDPQVSRGALLGIGIAYLGVNLFSLHWLKIHDSNYLRIVLDAGDALLVGLSSVLSGALASPLWLLLYPHVVAVSLRGSLALALFMGSFDGAIVIVLRQLTTEHRLGALHAITLVLCAFLVGRTSSYLGSVQSRLHEVNTELQHGNERLSSMVAAQEESRKAQEEVMAKLKESEERYRGLLERIQEGVLIIREGRIVYANRVFGALVEQPPGGLIGRDFLEFAAPGDRAELAERYRQWEDSQMTAGLLETRVLTEAGEERLVSLRAGAAVWEGRRSVICTIRDMTRERQMENAVKSHAERLAATNEIANAVNLSLTIEDILTVATREARRIVPFDRLAIALLDEEGSGIEIVTVGGEASRRRANFPREDLDWAFWGPVAWCEGTDEPKPKHLTELFEDLPIRSVETLPLFSKDRVIGSLHLGRTSAVPFSGSELIAVELVARHLAIALDNARLLESVLRLGMEFESLLEIAHGIVERLDLNELLPAVTRSVNRIMGTHHCLLLMRSLDDLVLAAQEGLEPEVIETLGRVSVGYGLSGWVAQEGKTLVVTDMKDDPRAMFGEMASQFGYRSYLGVPLRRGHDVLGTLEVITKEPRHFSAGDQSLMAAFADQAAVAIENARLFEQARSHLSEMAEANRRLEELDRLRKQYLRNVSHEFRTPLTVIKGYAEYLREGNPPDEATLRDVMRMIIESCDRVIDMVDTLIEVSRIEHGQALEAPSVQELDLREIAKASVATLRPAAERKALSLELVLPEEPLTLQGDPGLLQQMMRNLIDNAVKYSPEGACITVRAGKADEDLLFEVEDSGLGIPAEHLPRIFEKFYMVDGGITRRVGGTGVGLYLVREIVRLHNGTVEVKSHPGRGSLFSVRLPKAFQGTRRQTALA